MSGRQKGELPPQPHPILLRQHPDNHLSIEELFTQNSRKIQVLREDHQEMIATHVALKEDLSVAHQQLRQLSATARKVRDERDFEVKKVYERSLVVEAQVRGIDAIQIERDQVVADIRSLTENKLQLAADFRGIDSELSRVKLEAADLGDLKSDVDAMRLELHKGRAAIEFEKKTRAANLEQYQAMESNAVSMKSEIEKLRDELAQAEKRARAAAAAASNQDPGYLGNYRGTDMAYQGGHSTHYPMHQAAATGHGASSGPLYGQSTGDPALFDMHQTNVPKG